jgi:hypothetical protein
MNIYLTEKLLGNYLQELFKNEEIIHNKGFNKTRFKPDYCLPKKKLIIEFNGYQHYTSMKTMINDQKKYQIYVECGYRLITIPYFVQWSSELIRFEFGLKKKVKQTYPHGFIDKQCLLPRDFNEGGIKRFQEDLNHFSYLKDEIISSLKIKIKDLGIDLVLPKSLIDLIM